MISGALRGALVFSFGAFKNVIKEKVCPNCGSMVASLGGHIGSMPCQARRVREAMEREGWIADVSVWIVNAIQRAGGSVEKRPTKYTPGSKGTRSTLTEQRWVRKWLADLIIASCHDSAPVGAIPSDRPATAGRKKYVNELIEVWLANHQDPFTPIK